ncbi:translation initiation factor IF-5A [Candidatus Woesearchaeota archaeon]|nr:translation initiation factor IF-5A [Candidatus Woesearchaeota archaeon]
MGETKQSTAGSLKQGSYVIMNGAACVVKSVQTSRPGKHGHAKCRIEAVGMIDNQKRVEIFPAHDKVTVPIILKKPATILSIKEDITNVMDTETFETFDLKIPEEFKDKIKEGIQITYWEILDDKVIKEIK